MCDSLVSVIMPAYNAEEYIGEAIQSVLGQDYANFELLIINDGSTDKTGSIIYSFDDKRIRIFEQENRGVSAARNVGLKNMKGDYFCFLDSDDLFTASSISSRVSHFLDHPDIVYIDGSVIFKNEDLSDFIKKWKPSFKGEPLYDLVDFTGKSFYGPSWMIRSSQLGSCRFETDLSHVEDLFFYISLSITGGIYDYVNEDILIHRVHYSSAVHNYKRLIKCFRKVERKIYAKSSIPIFNKVKYSFKTRIISLKLLLNSLLKTFGIR